MKRWLFLIHRWLGIFGCLLIMLWFASGFVMMYMPFPQLTEVERFARLEDLSLEQVRISPPQAIAAAMVGRSDTPSRLRLLREGARQLYAVHFTNHGWIGVDAFTGQIVHINEMDAVDVATRFGKAEVVKMQLIERDQWSVSSALDSHRPLYAASMADGGLHYISSRTGEVVRDTTRWERGWNLVGAVVHWIYPTVLRRHSAVWHWTVVILSSYTLLTALLGVVIGLLRWKRYANGRCTPYSGAMRWHHVLGLGSALFVLSWLFSGLLSMNPGDAFSSPNITASQLGSWRGSEFSPVLPAIETLHHTPNGTGNIKEVEWFRDAEGTLAWLRLSDLDSRIGRIAQTGEITVQIIDADFVARHADSLGLGHSASVERLDGYDAYYDPRYRRNPLPVWRVKFNDSHKTWLHVSGINGQPLGVLNAGNRVHRWLYHGLHSWDFEWLITRRPLWDISVLLAMTLGTVFAGTSMVIAGRRLSRRRLSEHRLVPVSSLREPEGRFVQPEQSKSTLLE